jgi:hypothetical protein
MNIVYVELLFVGETTNYKAIDVFHTQIGNNPHVWFLFIGFLPSIALKPHYKLQNV